MLHIIIYYIRAYTFVKDVAKIAFSKLICKISANYFWRRKIEGIYSYE